MKKIFYLWMLLAGNVAMAQAQLVKVVQHYKISKEGAAFYPTFNESGDNLLYTSENYKGLYLYDLSNKKSDKITDVDGAGFNPVFSKDSRKVYYRQTERVNMRQLSTLICFDQQNKKNVRCSDTPLRSSSELNKVRNQVDRLAHDEITAYTDMLSLVLERNGVQEVLNPLSDGGRYLWGSLSPDKTKILFTAVGRGTYVCNLKGKIIAEIGLLNAPVWYGNDKIVGMIDKDNGDYIISSSIVMVSADGKKRQVLVPSTQKAMYPAANRQSGKIA